MWDGRITHLLVSHPFYHASRILLNASSPLTVGSQPLDVLAQRIFVSVGPSGANKDYLYELANAVRRLAPESFDAYLFALEVSLPSVKKL